MPQAFAQTDSLKREPASWHYGQGLSAGDEFVFEICDYIAKIPQTSSCYVVTLNFVALLPSNQEEVWIVSSQVDHETSTEMIFHLTKTPHKIKTDGANIPYADSLERTLGWISRFANEQKPQSLSIGSSWGTVMSYAEPVYLMVSRVDHTDSEEPTYLLSYESLKKSYLQIKEGFPFPLRAVVYKPVSMQEPPLLFAFQLLDHRSALELCSVGNPADKNKFAYRAMAEIKRPEAWIPNGTIMHEFGANMPAIDDEIVQLLKEVYGQNYMKKMEQSLDNFTKFIEIISSVIDSSDVKNASAK
jgi:hypothetical protein